MTAGLMWWAVASASLTIGVAGVSLLAGADFITSVIAASGVVILIWLLIPSRPNSTPKWFTLVLLALTFGSLLPNAISLVVQALALLGGYLAWLRVPRDERRGGSPVTWATMIMAFWVILMLHPNVPSIDVGALGFRKTVFCLVGLVIGASVAKHLVPAVERTTVRILTAAVLSSVVLHALFPTVERNIVQRSADVYTAVLEGEARLQGVFAGPFHAAVAGLILVVWAIARYETYKVEAIVVLMVGIVCLYGTLVRTAYVALALALATMILSSRTFGTVVKRVASGSAICIAALLLVSHVSPAVLSVVESILGYAADTRFLGRFDGYWEGLALFSQSPIAGWGAGSAGDTLASFFIFGEHVTSHNIVLKILVEGGLIGLILWIGLIISITRRIGRGTPLAALAAGLIGVVVGMGLTGSSLEALPLTFLGFLLIGLAVDQPDTPLQGSKNRLRSSSLLGESSYTFGASSSYEYGNDSQHSQRRRTLSRSDTFEHENTMRGQ